MYSRPAASKGGIASPSRHSRGQAHAGSRSRALQGTVCEPAAPRALLPIAEAGSNPPVLRRQHRLRRQSDFRAVYRQGRRYAIPELVLYLRPNGGAQTRVGFSIGKKVGSAVQRNRAKRLLRESCRDLWNAVRPGFDAVFVVRTSLARRKMPEVRAMVASLLREAGRMQHEAGESAAPTNGGDNQCAECSLV